MLALQRGSREDNNDASLLQVDVFWRIVFLSWFGTESDAEDTRCPHFWRYEPCLLMGLCDV